MMEIFPSKGDFRFSSDAIEYVTNVQSLRHGASCFLVTLTGDDRDSQPLEKWQHSNLHSLACYIGIATRILFEGLMESCSLYLETAMTELISNSTFRDTIQENNTTEGEEDGIDPLVERAFDDIPALADSLTEYEEHFLYQVMTSTGNAVVFLPHWFDAVLDQYSLHNTNTNRHYCACALHVVTMDAQSKANSTDKSEHPSLSRIAAVNSSGNSSGTCDSCSVEWEADILLFAVARSQVQAPTQIQPQTQDKQCHVLLRLLHDDDDYNNSSSRSLNRCGSGNTAGVDNISPSTLLVVSTLPSACSSISLIMSARIPLHAAGVLIEEVGVAVTGVDTTQMTLIGSNTAGSSLVQITADVLQKEFQQVWAAALRTAAVALFCDNLSQTKPIDAYQAALAATFSPSTTCVAPTVAHTHCTHYADQRKLIDHDDDYEVKCSGAEDPTGQDMLPDPGDGIEYIPQPPTSIPNARMESSNHRPSSASLRPGRTLKTCETQPI